MREKSILDSSQCTLNLVLGANVEIILFLDTIYKMLLGRNDDTFYSKKKYVLANKFLED
jgi:hypothetical protein